MPWYVVDPAQCSLRPSFQESTERALVGTLEAIPAGAVLHEASGLEEAQREAYRRALTSGGTFYVVDEARQVHEWVVNTAAGQLERRLSAGTSFAVFAALLLLGNQLVALWHAWNGALTPWLLLAPLLPVALYASVVRLKLRNPVEAVPFGVTCSALLWLALGVLGRSFFAG